jgi:hypothetical protein
MGKIVKKKHGNTVIQTVEDILEKIHEKLLEKRSQFEIRIRS